MILKEIKQDMVHVPEQITEEQKVSEEDSSSNSSDDGERSQDSELSEQDKYELQCEINNAMEKFDKLFNSNKPVDFAKEKKKLEK